MSVDVELHNESEIEGLNQRGGRTLSTVDLIGAGTLSAEMAAHLTEAVLGGASLLTAAGPGGVGKSTLLACLLHMLPAGERIVTASEPSVLLRAAQGGPAEPECYLAHEIGSGRFFGYIWGSQVPALFGLVKNGRRIASCLHADTLEETRGVLVGSLGIDPEAFGRVGLILFMVAGRYRGGTAHRMSAMYQRGDDGRHRLAYAWAKASDRFLAQDDLPAPPAEWLTFWRGLVEEGVRDTRAVRARYRRALLKEASG